MNTMMRSSGVWRQGSLAILGTVCLCLSTSLAWCQTMPAQQVSTDPQPEGEAPQRATPRKVGEDGLEYGGIVSAQTLTGSGHAFFVRFSEGWSQFDDVDDKVVLVKERPSPRGGTEMQVWISEDLLMKTPLPRNHVSVLAASERAVEFVHQRVQETQLQALLFNDPDLAKSGY